MVLQQTDFDLLQDLIGLTSGWQLVLGQLTHKLRSLEHGNLLRRRLDITDGVGVGRLRYVCAYVLVTAI
jgi:hypothetical protein